MVSPTIPEANTKGRPPWVPGPPPWRAPQPAPGLNPDPHRWFVTFYGEEWQNSTLKIILNTDTACHMFLRWTAIEPVYHVHPKMRRGLAVNSDGKYCFVEYQDLEQNEEGDTLVHTFDFPGWYACLWRWWYFWATAAELPTPSNTPMYKAHGFDYRPPPFYITSLGILDDPTVLIGDVKLDEGNGITIGPFLPFNTLIISHHV